MGNNEIIAGKEHSLSGLSPIQLLNGGESYEVIVISQHFDRMVATL